MRLAERPYGVGSEAAPEKAQTGEKMLSIKSRKDAKNSSETRNRPNGVGGEGMPGHVKA